MGSGTGSKMVLIVFIYYLVLFSIVPLVMMASGEGGEANLVTLESCSAPRTLYEPYSDGLNIDETFSKYDINDLSHLQCSRSAGVLSQEACESINGCVWGTPSLSVWATFRRFLGFSVQDPEPTCLETINANYYDIDTYTSVLTGDKVRRHDNTKGTTLNYGSICNHPEVILNQETCDLFSCSWGINNFDYDTELGEYKPVTGAISGFTQIWTVIGSMFTFSFEWGTGSLYADFIINLFLVYLPSIIVMFGIYVMIRS